MTGSQSGQSRRMLRVATRSSALAMAQTQLVVAQLGERAKVDCELVPVKTMGDTHLDRTISAIGVDGVFVTELFAALLDGRADVAVHSMKDLPTTLPRELRCAAVPKREDARDVLISKNNAFASFDALPGGASVGTSSLRRGSQVRLQRSDVLVVPLRGNVDTRVRKVLDGECDAAILALAGLKRAELLALVDGGSPLSFDVMVPAVGQGALCVQCRTADEEVVHLVEMLDHGPSALAIRMERAVLARLGGGCLAPIGVHVDITDGVWQLRAIVAATDGAKALRHNALGGAADAAEAVAAVEDIADKMLAAGGRELIAQAREQTA